MAEAGSLSCKAFSDILIRRVEHLDELLIKDITPTDGWVGHVMLGSFPAQDGVSHTFDRINRVFPNLAGCWEDVTVESCIGTPCDPNETEIGFGTTRDSYSLQRKSFKSQLFCYDLILSADRAKAQFAGYVEQLKQATNIIISDRFRTEAFRGAGTKVVSSLALTEFTYTDNGDCTEIVPSVLPTCLLTVQMLQRFVVPLMLNGYLGSVPDMPPMFEFVTDIETAWRLREGNAELQAMYRFDNFVKGGALYKYGITDAVGNFGIRIDMFPIRYQLLNDGVTLQRVYPYVNEAATQGIKGVVNDQWVNAHYQIDFIWNRMAMKSLVRSNTQINPMMPFAARDFGGKWQFVQDNLGADSNGCVIENTRRNKGKFIADFVNATQYVRPEWVIAILSLRDRSCIACEEPCSDDPGYVEQDYNSANDPCPNPQMSFTLCELGEGETYSISADDESITCNGVPIVHDASGPLADMDALVVWLNANVGSLGTFSAVGNANPLLLDDSTCNSVELDVVCGLE
jgi:hypothetical protein